VWHHSLLLVGGFGGTEAAVFFVQAMLPEGFPFRRFNDIDNDNVCAVRPWRFYYQTGLIDLTLFSLF